MINGTGTGHGNGTGTGCYWRRMIDSFWKMDLLCNQGRAGNQAWVIIVFHLHLHLRLRLRLGRKNMA